MNPLNDPNFVEKENFPSGIEDFRKLPKESNFYQILLVLIFLGILIIIGLQIYFNY